VKAVRLGRRVKPIGVGCNCEGGLRTVTVGFITLVINQALEVKDPMKVTIIVTSECHYGSVSLCSSPT
jgi:hypothetical protein